MRSRLLARWLSAGVLALALVTGMAPSPTASAAITVRAKDLRIQAHRGGPDLGAPENSVELFRLAVASGVVDRIETDVRVTSDNVLVLFHDAALSGRCTGAVGFLHQLAWSELRAVRCDGQPIPKLEEIFDVVRGTKVALNLELKHYDGMTTAQKQDFAKRVVTATLASRLPKSQVQLSSWFWRSYAGVVKKYGKGLRFSALELATRSQPTDAIYASVRRAKSLGVDGYAVSIKHAQRSLLAFIRNYGGMTVGVMDRSNLAETRYALANGVRTFTSDDPVRAKADLEDLLAAIKAKPLKLRTTQTALPKVKVLSKSMKKSAKAFPQVIGQRGLVPATAARQLDSVKLSVKITGKGSGTVELAPSGSRVGVDGVRIRIPKGTRTFTVKASPGDGGRLRVRVTGNAKVTVSVIGYARADY